MITAKKMLEYLLELKKYQLELDIYNTIQRPEFVQYIEKARKLTDEKYPTDKIIELLTIESNKIQIFTKSFYVANAQHYSYTIKRLILTRLYTWKVQLAEQVKARNKK